MAAPDNLPIDPVMPYALRLPWPGAWGQVEVVYDLYKCMAYIDDQATYMADSRRALRALREQQRVIAARPNDPTSGEAAYEWNRAYDAWQRADAIRQLQYFVLRVEYPGGQDREGRDPATWARYPTDAVLWLANEGYTQAKAGLTTDPKPATPVTLSLPPSAPAPEVAP